MTKMVKWSTFGVDKSTGDNVSRISAAKWVDELTELVQIGEYKQVRSETCVCCRWSNCRGWMPLPFDQQFEETMYR